MIFYLPYSRNQENNANNQNAVDEKSLSRILITMSGLFVFCQSIKIIPDMYELFECKSKNLLGHFCEMDGPIINGIVRTSHLLVCLNSSANFLIYYVCGTKFRRAFVATYSPIWKHCMINISKNKTGAFENEKVQNESTPPEEHIELHDLKYGPQVSDFRSKYGPTLV